MYRTNRGEVRFFHLEIEGGATSDHMSLILSDRSGEEYQDATADTSIALDFIEVARADTVTVLVDGERLIDSGERHNVRSEISLILQTLRDREVLSARSQMALTMTKIDAVMESRYADRAISDFCQILDHIRAFFGDVFVVIEPFKTAASPKKDPSMRGTGLSRLLSFWLHP